MLACVAMLLAAPWAMDPDLPAVTDRQVPATPWLSGLNEREGHRVPSPRERSKKELWLLDKSHRPDVHVSDADLAAKPSRRESPNPRPGSPNAQAEARLGENLAPVGTRITPVTTIYSIWNREAMALIPGQAYKVRFQLFLRDHYTHQSTQADTRLVGVLAAAALRFRAPRIEIVSGYRSPKYNLMLRKKGRQVARESQHTQGTAVDFRIRNVGTETLRDFVRSLRLGGVGYYPRTRFVHADTGKVRYWQGS